MVKSKKKKSKEKKKKNVGLTILIILVILVAIGVGGFFFVKSYIEKKIEESTGLNLGEIEELLAEINIEEIPEEVFNENCPKYESFSPLCKLALDKKIKEICDRCGF